MPSLAGEEHGRVKQHSLHRCELQLFHYTKILIMTKLAKIMLFAFIIGTLGIYMTSCDQSESILDTTIENSVYERSDGAKTNLLSEEYIDKFIVDWIESNHTSFNWNDNASDEMIYSALMHSDSILNINYLDPNIDMVEFFRENNRLPNTLNNKRDEIIRFVRSSERLHRNTVGLHSNDILPFGRDNRLPLIKIKVTDPLIISKLRDRFGVRLSSPGYSLSHLRSAIIPQNLGCTNADPEPSPGVHPDDYTNTTLPYISKYSWHFDWHNIPTAWETTRGAGVKVAVLDSGGSDSQENLVDGPGGQFNSGASTGRTLEKKSTLLDLDAVCFVSNDDPPVYSEGCFHTPNDVCGHGTAMAGLIAAPQAGDGNAMGIAPEADLIIIKASNDVLFDRNHEKKGVADAIRYVTDETDARIISMSMASLADNDNIEMEIADAVGAGKLIFTAAGTIPIPGLNPSLVLFPARLSTVNGVTGVKNQFPLTPCGTCFTSNNRKIDFVAVMEKDRNGERIGPVTLASYSDFPKYSNGSSAATATIAGIAALVWSKPENLNLPAEDILFKLRSNSSNWDTNLPDNGFDDSFGYGVIDAAAAVE